MLPVPRAHRLGPTVAAAASLLAASTAAVAQEPAVTVDLGKGVRLDLVLIQPGTFTQGSPATEAGRNPDETQRQVTLPLAFYMGKVPVTRRQFARFVEDSGYRTEAERGTSGGFGWDGSALVQKPGYNWQNPGFSQTDNHPVVLVTFADARAFVGWMSKVSGRSVELPSEAQWEYAARAGTTTPFHTGDSPDAVGWFKDNAGRGTKPVGQKPANRWGLFDMNGNVWEWCLDYYGPYSAGPVTAPVLAASPPSEDKARRVLRGGSWLKDGKNLRSAARYRNDPGSRNADNGFRVIASIGKGAAAPAPKTGAPSSAPGAGAVWGFVVGIFCMIFGFMGGIIALVVVLGRRAARKAREQRAAGHGISLQPGNDGFWVRAPRHLKGSSVQYRYRAGGFVRTGMVVLDGTPAQFVYTGATPELAEVVDVVAAAGAWKSQQPSGHHSRSHREDHHHDHFHGYPSAY